MKAMLAVLLFASLFYLAPAKEVSINSTVVESANCTTSFDCWFFDPVFWVNQIIPSDNDEVVIVDITAGSALFINSSISLAVLDIESNFHIYITASANVSITNLTLSSFAHLHVQDQAQVYGVGITNIVNGSELSVSGTAFAQAGSFFLLDNSSSIWGFSGYTGLHADYNIIQGTLSFSNTAMFASTGGVIEFVDKSFTFEISPLLYNAVFRNSQITFKAGYRSSRSANLTASVVYIQNMAAVTLNNFFVDELSSLAVVSVPSCTFVNQNILGSLVVTSSNIVVANLTSFGPVVIHGAVTINATNSAHFNIISFATGANGEAANLTVNTNYLHVRGVQAIDFPQVVFNVQDFAYFRGAVHVEGGINVAGMMLVEDSGMHVIGDINVGFNAVEAGGLVLDETQLIVDTLRIAHSGFLSLNFSEISGNVSLHQNSTLTHHESKFNGNVYNNGYIEVHSALAIGGNYTQGPNGILLSYLELANTSTRTSGYLQISGNAAIEGAIKYSVLSKPKSESNIKLVIVQTLTGVTGKFHADPEDVSDSGHKASVLYSANDVYLTFGKKASNPASIWWVWFIVAAAIIAIVGLIVLLVKTHRRRQYSAVEM